MRTRVLVWIGISAAVMAVLFKTPLVSSILLFIVFGMIPGTSITVPFWLILVAYPLIMAGLMYWLSLQRYPAPPVMAKARSKRKPRAKKTVTPATAPEAAA